MFKMEALVKYDSDIKKEVQIQIIENLIEHFPSLNKDMLYIIDGKIHGIPDRSAFDVIVAQHLSIAFREEEIKTYDEEKEKNVWNIKINDIYQTLRVHNSYKLLTHESDLFAKKQVVLRDSLSELITVVSNKIHIKEIHMPKVAKQDYNEIVDDYKNHFVFFDNLLKLIIDMRFAKNRKASFLHLRVMSDWGKSFLSGIFQNLQIGFEIDYHNLMNKGANDISPIQVRNSFVMILDEFNNFSGEMKKLSHDFRFAPKFGMTEKVPLYLKILMSAEKSPSFSGGVDAQIVNRVMVMDMPDNTVKKLTARAIYNKHGNAKYMSVLEHYAYLELKKHLQHYLSMEKFEAHKQADIAVRKMLKNHPMEGIVDVKEEIANLLREKIREILDSELSELPSKMKEIKLSLLENRDGVLIKTPKATMEKILKNYSSEPDYKKMRHKLTEFKTFLPLLEDCMIKAKSINNKKAKGLFVDITEPETHEEIKQRLAESGNLIIEESTIKGVKTPVDNGLF